MSDDICEDECPTQRALNALAASVGNALTTLLPRNIRFSITLLKVDDRHSVISSNLPVSAIAELLKEQLLTLAEVETVDLRGGVANTTTSPGGEA